MVCSLSVMAGLVPAIPLVLPLHCPPKRDHRDTVLTRRPAGDEALLPPLPARGERGLPPHLPRNLHDHAQLRPLFVLGENIALLGRGEAALRREAKLIDIDEFRRLIDAAFDRVLAFQPAGLAGDEPERHRLA